MATYSVFVRCAIFRRVKTTVQNDLQQCSMLAPKGKPKCFQNRIKNCIDFWSDVATILAPFWTLIDPKSAKSELSSPLFAFQSASQKKLCFLIALRCLWMPSGAKNEVQVTHFGTLLDTKMNPKSAESERSSPLFDAFRRQKGIPGEPFWRPWWTPKWTPQTPNLNSIPPSFACQNAYDEKLFILIDLRCF